jgi:hypothetical protein
MRNSVRLPSSGAAAISFALGACQKAGKAAGADADSVKQAIKADEAKWNEDFKAKDTEGLAGHYSDDAYFVAPGLKPADGSTAIRQIYATSSTDPAWSVQFASDKIDVAGFRRPRLRARQVHREIHRSENPQGDDEQRVLSRGLQEAG